MPISTGSTATTPQALPLAEEVRRYIVRPGGVMVPLVPVDQLPFALVNIPKELSHHILKAEKWDCAGATQEPPSPIQIRIKGAGPPIRHPKFQAPDAEVRGQSTASEGDTSDAEMRTRAPPSSPVLTPAFSYNARTRTETPLSKLGVVPKATSLTEAAVHVNPLKDVKPDSPGLRAPLSSPVRFSPAPSSSDKIPELSLTDNMAAIYPKDAQRFGYSQRRLPPSGILPDPSKKEYCSYWIKTGECAYQQQGCKYKHEMPPLDVLREKVGLWRVPQWWKEKTALRPAGTWAEGRLKNNNEGRESSNEPEDTSLWRPTLQRRHRGEADESHQNFIDGTAISKADAAALRPLEISGRFKDLIDLSTPPLSPQLAGKRTSIASSDAECSTRDSSVPSFRSPSPSSILSVRSGDDKLTTTEKALYIRRDSDHMSVADERGEHKQPRAAKGPVTDRKRSMPLSPSKKAGLTASKHAVPNAAPAEPSTKPKRPQNCDPARKPAKSPKQAVEVFRENRSREKGGCRKTGGQ
ncbi:hypothetical protein BCR34DRAFT_608338 [Clohesyomyces aquaticus]|uniref:C3H1-type domain-containing protein n=1 Tax=Clohesyomyces aquaticus TaxID=1231657 RepID=A0A1Y1Y8A9_9PLEO|nr:hypothetical protein BCR34DRAFT_608338 [Clohesyomyces aquaticus]